jgi:preprotein translocase subunit SecF
MEFFRKSTSFAFMRTRKMWYAVSAVVIIGSFAGILTRGLNLAIDFTGGVTIEAEFPGPANLDAIRGQVAQAGWPEAQVQNFGTSRDIVVRLPPIPDGQGEAMRARVDTALRAVDPAVEIRRVEVVGPQIGAELRESALWALGFTMLLIFIYVSLRFHTWRLSVGAILAAMHDPILVIGLFAWTQMSFDLSVIAAILAVIGYSLNDTVVIFDRIRERFLSNRRLTPEQVLDQSVNQTLSRTIITSGVTLLVVIALFALGGPALHSFSAALIFGVIVGTYSSIYIASAIALDLGMKAEHLFPLDKKEPLDHLP